MNDAYYVVQQVEIRTGPLGEIWHDTYVAMFTCTQHYDCASKSKLTSFILSNNNDNGLKQYIIEFSVDHFDFLKLIFLYFLL